MRRKLKNISHQLMIVLVLLSETIGADGVTCNISPSNGYTTFENNASTFTFNCSGNGTLLYWTVDGYTTGTLYVQNKGISYALPVSPDGVHVYSNLTVPTTKANNNTVVNCIVLDISHNRQSCGPVRLILQGYMYVPTTQSVPTAGNNTSGGINITTTPTCTTTPTTTPTNGDVTTPSQTAPTTSYNSTISTSGTTAIPDYVTEILLPIIIGIIFIIIICVVVFIVVMVMYRRKKTSVVITSDNTPSAIIPLNPLPQ